MLPVEQEEYKKSQLAKSNTCSTFSSHQRSRIDPYATLTPSERYASQISEELKGMHF